MPDPKADGSPAGARAAWDNVAALHQAGAAGGVTLGPSAAYQYRHDPKHLCFVLSRYKFCAKMLTGKRAALEVGCGDAIGTPIVAQAVQQLVAIDWDEALIEDNRRRLAFLANCRFERHDISSMAAPGAFDAIYSVDVLEHIAPEAEATFMRNCVTSLDRAGVFIAGTPNVRADAYASASSRLGHINLKDAAGLRHLLDSYFENSFLFSMNDEVVHTGFSEMAHYLFGVGVGVRR